jgi:hypothetical protein
MKEIPQINIPFEELRSLVIDAIKSHSKSFEFKNLCNSIGAKAVKEGFVKNPNSDNFQTLYFPLQKSDENRVREIVWNLIVERVVTIGDYHNDSWPWLSLTEYGEKVVSSLEPTPNDPSSYIERLKKEIPQLDKVIITYLTESIRTYNINQLLSSTITLGCASEKALLVLIGTYNNTFKQESAGEKFTKKIEGKFIKTQFDEFDKDFRRNIGHLPYELRENYSNTLLGVFEMIRKNRNSAGHPTGKQVDKDTLFANLQVFIPYCKYIYGLVDYLENNPHD